MSGTGLRATVLTALVLIVAACTQTIHEVDAVKYGYAVREDLTVAEIKPVVEEAAQTTGWTISDVQTGSFKAYREWSGNKHSITVQVTYRPQDFDIDYVDSKQLGYTGDWIHHSYNDFVNELEGEIQRTVSKL